MAEQDIILALRGGRELTWLQIKRITGLSDDRIGIALATLFYLRLIRTTHHRGERVYLALPPPTRNQTSRN